MGSIAIGSSTSITPGTTPIVGGTDTCILFDKAGKVAEDVNFEWDYTDLILKIQAKDAIFIIPNASGNNWFVAEGGNPGMGGTLTGFRNFGMGAGALLSLTSGSHNTAIGVNAAEDLVSGNFNTVVGESALLALTDTNFNVAIGAAALTAMVHGTDNVAIGYQAMLNTTGGSNQNICIGSQAGQNVNTSFGGHVCIGFGSAGNVSSGFGNVIIGWNSGATITTGGSNIVIGNQVDVLTAGASGQLSIGNYIYGTGLTGTGSTISSGQIGIGIKGPTASLHLQASTTGQANLRFDPTSAAGPTSPNDGDMWYDGTNLKFRQAGTTHTIV